MNNHRGGISFISTIGLSSLLAACGGSSGGGSSNPNSEASASQVATDCFNLTLFETGTVTRTVIHFIERESSEDDSPGDIYGEGDDIRVRTVNGPTDVNGQEYTQITEQEEPAGDVSIYHFAVDSSVPSYGYVNEYSYDSNNNLLDSEELDPGFIFRFDLNKGESYTQTIVGTFTENGDTETETFNVETTYAGRIIRTVNGTALDVCHFSSVITVGEDVVESFETYISAETGLEVAELFYEGVIGESIITEEKELTEASINGENVH